MFITDWSPGQLDTPSTHFLVQRNSSEDLTAHSKVGTPCTLHILLTAPFYSCDRPHDKANTLHRDLNLENIILCMDVDGVSRVGHLTNWDISCKTNGTTISASKLPVCGDTP